MITIQMQIKDCSECPFGTICFGIHVCYLDDKSNTVYEEDELNILNPFVQKLADAYDEKSIDEKDILSQAAQVLDELKKTSFKRAL